MTDDYIKHRINSLIIFISLDSYVSKKNDYLKRIIDKINEYHGDNNIITIIQLCALFAQKKSYNPYVDSLYRLACVLLFKNDNTKNKITTVINALNTMLNDDNIYFNAMLTLLQINKNNFLLEPSSQLSTRPPSSQRSSRPSSQQSSIHPLSVTSGHPLSVTSEHPLSLTSAQPLSVTSGHPTSVKSSQPSSIRSSQPSPIRSLDSSSRKS